MVQTGGEHNLGHQNKEITEERKTELSISVAGTMPVGKLDAAHYSIVGV